MKTILKLASGAMAVAIASGAHAAPVFWSSGSGGNDHWYDISRESATFSTALANAGLATPIAGYTPYLVTVTSLGEASFLNANFGQFGMAWAAGSDSAVEGTWRWLAGPEAGQAFWKDGVTLTYSAWNGGEPNNAGNEDGLILHQFGGITWNDGSTDLGLRYIIEYGPNATSGGVPEPSTWALLMLGFGAIGWALRRRPATATRVGFAY